MWEMFLQKISVFSLLCAGIFVIPGIMTGIYHSCNEIIGYSNDRLFNSFEFGPLKKNTSRMGIIPLVIQGIGVGSLSGGIAWILMAHYRGESGFSFLFVSSIGGGLGLVAALFMAFGNTNLLLLLMIIGGMLWVSNSGIMNTPDSHESGLARVGLIIIFATGAFGSLEVVIALIVITWFISIIPFPKIIARVCSAVLSPLLILSRHHTILCETCFRYTHPFKSHYRKGIRYCEHYQEEVEYTPDPGEVIFTFGTFSLEQEERRFIFMDPTFGADRPESEVKLFFFSKLDLNQQAQPVDVSEVYIDTKTCNPYHIERFITYILNNPPERGVRSVHIFYQGELDSLGENLKNALQNTFPQIEKIET